MEKFILKRPRSAPPFPEEERPSGASLKTQRVNDAFADAERALAKLEARLDAPAQPAPVAGVAIATASTAASTVGEAIEAAGRAGATQVTVHQSPQGDVRAVAEFPKVKRGRKDLLNQRYDDIVEAAAKADCTLVCSREDWPETCTGTKYKPELIHNKCGTKSQPFLHQIGCLICLRTGFGLRMSA